MLLASDFRRIARDGLRNCWGIAILTGLVAVLLGAATQLSGTGSSSRKSINELQSNGYFDSKIFHTIFPFLIGIGSILLIWGIATIIIGGAVTLGYAKFNLNIVDLKEVRFNDLFSQFDRIGQGFCMQFFRALFIFLWTLLFIIPGIIASYSYSMTPYILAENPQLNALDAIHYSKEMMRGNKIRLFCLQISFIGWMLLSLLTCGLGMLVVSPYMEAATAAFYREVSGTFQQNNPSTYYGGYDQQYQYNNQDYNNQN